jgi:hypothetical protein
MEKRSEKAEATEASQVQVHQSGLLLRPFLSGLMIRSCSCRIRMPVLGQPFCCLNQLNPSSPGPSQRFARLAQSFSLEIETTSPYTTKKKRHSSPMSSSRSSHLQPPHLPWS